MGEPGLPGSLHSVCAIIPLQSQPVSGSTGSGNPSVGNFLDAADFGVGVGPSVKNVPEPASTLGLLAIGALGATSAFKRKNNQN